MPFISHLRVRRTLLDRRDAFASGQQQASNRQDISDVLGQSAGAYHHVATTTEIMIRLMILKEDPNKLGFADIPGELRNMIYSYLQEPAPMDALLESLHCHGPANHGTNLLLACRLIYLEFRALARPNLLLSSAPETSNSLKMYCATDNPHEAKIRAAPFPLSNIETLVVRVRWNSILWFWSNTNSSIFTTKLSFPNVQRIVLQLCICCHTGYRCTSVSTARKLAPAVMALLDGLMYPSLTRVVIYICGSKANPKHLTTLYRLRLVDIITAMFNHAERNIHATVEDCNPVDVKDYLTYGAGVFDELGALDGHRKIKLVKQGEGAGRSIMVEFHDSLQVCRKECVLASLPCTHG